MSEHVILQCVCVLPVLHDNHMTHTDLKPENILFVSSDADVIFNPQKVVTSVLADDAIATVVSITCCYQCFII